MKVFLKKSSKIYSFDLKFNAEKLSDEILYKLFKVYKMLREFYNFLNINN
jgi:hypothetical protein